MGLEWFIKNFNELRLEELYRILQLRISAFVLEQKSIYVDLDDGDQEALHLFATTNGKLIAYARMHIYPSSRKAIVRRVVVHKDFRQQKLGFTLMQKVLAYLESLKIIELVELSAQLHLQHFYEKLGFVAEGQPYDDVGIKHIKMKKPLI